VDILTACNHTGDSIVTTHWLSGLSTEIATDVRIPIGNYYLVEPSVLNEVAELVMAHEDKLKRDNPEAFLTATQAMPDSLTARWYSYNVLRWDGQAIEKLRQFFHQSYLSYISEIEHFQRQTAYIQCWANTNRRNEYFKPHMHSRLDLMSGFVTGNFAVRITDYQNSFTHYSLRMPPGTKLPTDTVRHSIMNVPGLLTIFPGALTHFTDPWLRDEPRISLAFDINPKAGVDHQLQQRQIGLRPVKHGDTIPALSQFVPFDNPLDDEDGDET
jgi:hypothetical protein